MRALTGGDSKSADRHVRALGVFCSSTCRSQSARAACDRRRRLTPPHAAVGAICETKKTSLAVGLLLFARSSPLLSARVNSAVFFGCCARQLARALPRQPLVCNRHVATKNMALFCYRNLHNNNKKAVGGLSKHSVEQPLVVLSIESQKIERRFFNFTISNRCAARFILKDASFKSQLIIWLLCWLPTQKLLFSFDQLDVDFDRVHNLHKIKRMA